MTDKLFWQNPYQTQLETLITSVQGNEIITAETILFAFSGGQESDHGTIAGLPILKAHIVERDIVYTLAEDHGLKMGDRVIMHIDWQRRYRLMRLHFAAEIILELVLRMFENIEKVGAHISEDKARIDFAYEGTISEWLPTITHAAEEIIASDHRIISAFSDENNEQRFWRIEGFAQVPCSGTHPRSTGEIGGILLKRQNPGKGKERIEIYLQNPSAVG